MLSNFLMLSNSNFANNREPVHIVSLRLEIQARTRPKVREISEDFRQAIYAIIALLG